MEEYVDEIAERAVQLGGVAEGTARDGGEAKFVARIPAQYRGRPQPRRGAVVGPGGVRQGRHGRPSNEANDLGDLDTADLFTEVSRGIDKWLWFVEAHLQAER